MLIIAGWLLVLYFYWQYALACQYNSTVPQMRKSSNCFWIRILLLLDEIKTSALLLEVHYYIFTTNIILVKPGNLKMKSLVTLITSK